MKEWTSLWVRRVGAALLMVMVLCGLIYGGSLQEASAAFRPFALFSFFDGWFGVRTDAAEKLWEDALAKLDEVANLHLEATYDSYIDEEVGAVLVRHSQSSADIWFHPYRTQGIKSSSSIDQQNGRVDSRYGLFGEEPVGEHTNAYRSLYIGHHGAIIDTQTVPELQDFRFDDPVHPQLLSWLQEYLGCLTKLSVEGTEIVGNGEAIHLSGQLPLEAVVDLIAQEIALPQAVEAKLRDLRLQLSPLRLHFWVDNLSGHISKLELTLDEVVREVYSILLREEATPSALVKTYSDMESLCVRVSFLIRNTNQVLWFDNSGLLDHHSVQQP